MSKQKSFTLPITVPFVQSGSFTETCSAIEQIKQHLPNTRKRLQRETYRNFLVNNKRKRDSEELAQHIGHTAEPQKENNVKNILKRDEKTLKQIRDYAFTHQFQKVKNNATQPSKAGWIKPICEKMEKEIRENNIP